MVHFNGTVRTWKDEHDLFGSRIGLAPHEVMGQVAFISFLDMALVADTLLLLKHGEDAPDEGCHIEPTWFVLAQRMLKLAIL